MLKGIQQSMRDKRWHDRHAKQLKRRKHIRQVHIDNQRIFIEARAKETKEAQRKADESATTPQKKDWNKLQWILMAIWFRITNPFRYLIRIIKYKYGNVQA